MKQRFVFNLSLLALTGKCPVTSVYLSCVHTHTNMHIILLSELYFHGFKCIFKLRHNINLIIEQLLLYHQ